MSASAAASNSLGVQLNRQGQLAEAEAAFRQAVVLEPDHAEAHYNLGVTLRDLGRGDEAADAFRRALELRPGHAEGHNNLGIILLGQGRPEEAAASFAEALVLKPSHAKAHSNLGIALMDQGRLDEGITAFQRALALKPDHAKAHYNLGVALQHQGRLDEAAQSFHRALTHQPDYAEALYNLANQGALNDGSPAAETALARLGRMAETSERLEPKDREALLFALAKTSEGRGDFDRAFDCMAQANTIRRAGLSFDIAQAELRMAAVADTFDAALVQRLQGAGAASERPIFIVGMPRSGTTLIEQIVSAHSKVQGAGEIGALAAVVAQARLAEGLTAEVCRTLGEAYLASLPLADPGVTRLTDKALSNIEQIGLIQLCLPNARIIHCRRDPRDVGLSCFATRFSEGVEYACDLTELGRYWQAQDKLMAHWRAVLPPGRMLEVPYEAVVEDLDGWARRLIAHCGLDWEDACLNFHQSGRAVRTASFAQVRRPIYSSSVGRWRRFARHLGPLLEALGEPWANQA